MKNLLLLGFAIILFSSCVERHKKVMTINFKFIEKYDEENLETPMEPAIEKATVAWEKTKVICNVVRCLMP